MSASSSAIESVLVENRVFPAPEAFAQAARISGMPAYQALCAEADADYEGFWARLAREHLDWSRPFSQTLDTSNAPFFQWFADGELNASANCLDRHMGTPVEHKTAIVFEADDGTVTRVSYRQLLERVGQFANAPCYKAAPKCHPATQCSFQASKHFMLSSLPQVMSCVFSSYEWLMRDLQYLRTVVPQRAQPRRRQ